MIEINMKGLFLTKNVSGLKKLEKSSMDQRFLEKSCRYSIRKLTVGTASVLLGAIFLGSHQVGADSIVGSQNESNHLEAAPAIESPTDGIEGSKPENPYIAPISEEKSSSPDTEV